MPKDIKEQIKVLFNQVGEKSIANQLQKLNDLFLTQYKLKIDNIEIIPLETEIYYFNEKHPFKDKMIHKTPEQKNNFGKLYFHKRGGYYGGVDICLSEENYYLSILLRSAIVNSISIWGPNKVKRQFYNEALLPIEIQEIISKLTNKTNILFKRDKYINTSNIYHQKRIQGKAYKEGEIYKLNSLNLGEKINGKYQYLKEIKHNFYSLKRKQEIINNFETRG